MKSLSYITIFALLAIAPAIVSAFAPGRIPSQKVVASKFNTIQLNLKFSKGAPAKSKEEDVDLTRAIIMSHIAMTDDDIEDDIIGDDDFDSEESVDVEKNEPLKKIKSVGRKIKKKLKSKLKKD